MFNNKFILFFILIIKSLNTYIYFSRNYLCSHFIQEPNINLDPLRGIFLVALVPWILYCDILHLVVRSRAERRFFLSGLSFKKIEK